MGVLTQKFYCYVDESGQDPSSRQFVAVAIVVPRELKDDFQRQLLDIEQTAKTYGLKWHKTRARGFQYLAAVLHNKIAHGQTFIGYFKKPTPYFFPIVDTIESAIKQTVQDIPSYRATVYIDGIDAKKATELTNALRSHDIRLRHVRTARDESEPLIRLADMWAGCARAAALGNKQAEELILTAYEQKHLIVVTSKRPQ